MKVVTIFLLAIVLTIFSCKKNDATGMGSNETKEMLAKKWNVTILDNSGIAWVEFLYGNTYIVKYENGSSVTGTYSIDNTYRLITLSDLGLINIELINENSFRFSLKLKDGSDVTTLTCTAAEEYPASRNTGMLTSKKWNLYKAYYDFGQNFDTTYYPQTNQHGTGDIKIEVIFSESGTYFVTTIAKKETGFDTSYFNQHWKWNDATESKFKYFDGGVDSGYVDIAKLTGDTLSLKDNTERYFFTH